MSYIIFLFVLVPIITSILLALQTKIKRYNYLQSFWINISREYPNNKFNLKALLTVLFFILFPGANLILMFFLITQWEEDYSDYIDYKLEYKKLLKMLLKQNKITKEQIEELKIAHDVMEELTHDL
jgi:hypothetical protein